MAPTAKKARCGPASITAWHQVLKKVGVASPSSTDVLKPRLVSCRAPIILLIQEVLDQTNSLRPRTLSINASKPHLLSLHAHRPMSRQVTHPRLSTKRASRPLAGLVSAQCRSLLCTQKLMQVEHGTIFSSLTATLQPGCLSKCS